jgi:hypothetical protein
MILETEASHIGEWVIVEGVSLTYLGTVKIKIGEVEKAAFIEGSKAQIRCPNLPQGRVPVRVDGKKVGDLQIL